MCPTISVFLAIVGAFPVGLGSSFGSPFWVTSTGAWSRAKYLPLPAVTSTELFWVPRVRPAKELKSNRTCRVSVLPPQGLPGSVCQTGFEPLTGSGAAIGAAPAYETADEPGTTKKPSGRLTWTKKLVAIEQSRSKSTW